MLNKSYQVISTYVREWEAENGVLLPLKGYQMDQGSRPTHKKEIVRLYEQGLEPPDIARETQHDLKSVERYLQDYRRVKMLSETGHGRGRDQQHDWTGPLGGARIHRDCPPVSPGVGWQTGLEKHGDEDRCPN